MSQARTVTPAGQAGWAMLCSSWLLQSEREKDRSLPPQASLDDRPGIVLWLSLGSHPGTHRVVEELGEGEGAPHFLFQGWNGLTSIPVLGGDLCLYPQLPRLQHLVNQPLFPQEVGSGRAGVKNF